MTIHYLKGDATDPIETGAGRIIAHVCNDRGGWGRGFVLAVSKRWSEPERDYRLWARLGTGGLFEIVFEHRFELGAVQLVKVEADLWVANMIAQHGCGAEPRRRVDYEALRTCLREVSEKAYLMKCSLHMPRIGCGLGGGEWKQVEHILVEECSSNEVYVYDL